MSEVTTRGVEVLIDDESIHRAVSPEAADQLADWVRYQIGAGTSVAAIRGMMRGEHAETKAPPQAAPSRKRTKKTAPEVDLAVLDGSIGDLTDALASGDLDAHLDALLAAEEGGKGRKGALGVIRSRIDEVG